MKMRTELSMNMNMSRLGTKIQTGSEMELSMKIRTILGMGLVTKWE